MLRELGKVGGDAALIFRGCQVDRDSVLEWTAVNRPEQELHLWIDRGNRN